MSESTAFLSVDQAELDETKRMKVRLPVRQHLQLQQLKILDGQDMSETVRQAVQAYLEKTGDPLGA